MNTISRSAICSQRTSAFSSSLIRVTVLVPVVNLDYLLLCTFLGHNLDELKRLFEGSGREEKEKVEEGFEFGEGRVSCFVTRLRATEDRTAKNL